MEIKPPKSEDIKDASKNFNFGNGPRDLLIKSGLLKYASGYSSGWSVMTTLQKLKLLGTHHGRRRPALTKYGRLCLYEWFAPYIAQHIKGVPHPTIQGHPNAPHKAVCISCVYRNSDGHEDICNDCNCGSEYEYDD